MKREADETISRSGRTDESVIRQREAEDPEAPHTLRTGFPMVGSDVLDAVGSNGNVRRAMHDVLHTPDDERMATRLGPEQSASVAFRPDRALGDAGAEFAAEFGRDFVMAATTGEDFGEIYDASALETSEMGGPTVQETGMSVEIEDLTEFAELIEDETPSVRQEFAELMKSATPSVRRS